MGDDAGKKKILVVDDDVVITSELKSFLEHAGRYEVETLSETKEIIAYLHVFKPDVVLLDLIMPGVDGIEVCEMLANDPIGIGVPIIVISGLEKEADKAKVYKLGAVDYLVKPVEGKTIIAAVEKAIKHKLRED